MSLSGAGGGGSSGAVRAGGAYVELGTKDDLLIRGLKDAQRRVAAFAAGSVKGVAAAVGVMSAGTVAALTAGATAGAAFGVAVKSAADRATQVGTLAARFGDTAENFSRLAGAAEVSGLGLDDFANILENLPERIADAATGAGEAADNIRRLGLDARQLMALPLTQRFEALADSLSTLNDVQRTSALGKLFSDQGQQLDRLLAGGSAGLRSRLAEAEKLGAVLSGDQVARATEANRAFNASWLALRSGFQQAALAALPTTQTIAAATSALTDGVVAARGMAEAGYDAAKGYARIAAAAVGAGNTVQAVTDAFSAGRLGDAVRVAVAALNLEFAKGMDDLARQAEAGANAVLSAFKQAADGIVLGFRQAFQQVGKWLNIYALGLDSLGLPGGQSFRGIAGGLQAGAGTLPGVPNVSINGALTGPAADRLKAAQDAALYARVQSAFRGAFGGKGGGPAAPAFVGAAGGISSSAGAFLGGGPNSIARFMPVDPGSIQKQALTVEKQQLDRLDKLVSINETMANSLPLRAT